MEWYFLERLVGFVGIFIGIVLHHGKPLKKIKISRLQLVASMQVFPCS